MTGRDRLWQAGFLLLAFRTGMRYVPKDWEEWVWHGSAVLLILVLLILSVHWLASKFKVVRKVKHD